MINLDFENDLNINLNDLHTEWKNHANLRYKYASEVSYLDKCVKKANEGIAVIKAKIIKQCKIDNMKSTVQQIDAFCSAHPDYLEAKNERIDIEYNLNMIKNALRAFDDRKTALENEVKLWTGNYFSTPVEDQKVPSDQKMETKVRDESSNKVRNNINCKRVRK